MKRENYPDRILFIFDAWVSCSYRIGEHIGAGLPIPRGLVEEHTKLDEDLWAAFQDTYGVCICDGSTFCEFVDLHGDMYCHEHDYAAAGRLSGEVNGRVMWELPTPTEVDYLDSGLDFEFENGFVYAKHKDDLDYVI